MPTLRKGKTAVKKSDHTIRKQGRVNEQEFRKFLSKSGQFVLPMVDLIEQCQLACGELIDVTGRAAIQAALQLFAAQAGGAEPQQGKRRPGDVVSCGRQPSQVFLSDRKLGVERHRLRTKEPKSREVEVQAYMAMQNRGAMGASAAADWASERGGLPATGLRRWGGGPRSGAPARD